MKDKSLQERTRSTRCCIMPQRSLKTPKRHSLPRSCSPTLSCTHTTSLTWKPTEVLHSADPKPPQELRPQFEALCKALGLNPDAEDVLEELRDPSKVPWQSITKVIEEEKLGPHGTFRGCLSDDWVQTSPGSMERQRNGSFAQDLKKHGVKYIVMGDVSEEWYLYSIAHPIETVEDFVPNLERYFSPDFVAKLMQLDREGDDIQRRFGELLSLAQVYLPVYILARDLSASGFPVLRYQIRWTPEQTRPLGECFPHLLRRTCLTSS